MRLRLTVLLTGLLAFIGVGCGHSQVPPVLHSANYTWSAPQPTSTWTGCTTALPCTYIVSTLQVPSGTSTCPAPDSTHVYNPLNQSNPTSALNLKDTGDAGSTVCGIVQTVQSGAISVPSAPSNVVTVLANPLAPAITGTAAELVKPKVQQDDGQPKLSYNVPAPALNASSR